VILDVSSVRAAHREFVASLVATHGSPCDVDEALQRWRDAVGAYFAERDGTEFRPAREAYRRGVTAIVGEDVDEAAWLETFREHVDAYTSSESVGRTRPDPAMFETALEKADVDPVRAVMVGDRYEHDMAGASAHGIATVADGAEDGPAVDYRLDDLRRLPALLGFEG
jgi:putative hydrolase of the HAD superfamily